MSSLFIGLMSGTSLDGVDGVLVDFTQRGPSPLRTLAHTHRAFDPSLTHELLALNTPGPNELHRAQLAGNALARLYAQVVAALCEGSDTPPAHITAIGAHGQTVRHRPREFDGAGYTVQLNSPALLAELTGIDVIADFRRRDMAAGGQGAPLVPAFHEALFRHPTVSRAVVNIGGISNITWMPAGGRTLGFDCGPGNVLLDGWSRRHLGAAFDENGAWAKRGRTDSRLLKSLLAEPFFDAAPPKSTGRELFRMGWLDQRLEERREPEDVQSTLTDFTAHAIVDALDRFCAKTDEIYLSGGGARNPTLVGRIEGLARGRPVAPTDVLGVPTAHVESMAFAWLAMKFVRREAVDLTAVTGARQPRVLGALYPA